MTQQQGNQSQRDEQQNTAIAPTNSDQDLSVRQQTGTHDDTSDPDMSTTNDAGDAISEGELYDASGAATGGGVDTPDAVQRSSEAATEQQKHIHQGSSAYMGGGADNGSNL